MPDVTIAVEQATDELSQILQEGLQFLLEGATADIISFTDRMAHDLAEAMTLPVERREEVLAEIQAQVGVIAEHNRVRAVNQGWGAVQRVLLVVQRTVAATLAAAVVA